MCGVVGLKPIQFQFIAKPDPRTKGPHLVFLQLKCYVLQKEDTKHGRNLN